MATPEHARWHRWPLIVALAFGVLAMHHLPDVPASTGHAAAPMAMPPGTHLVASITAGTMIDPGGGEGCACMDMMGHLCLAVLDAAYTSPTPALALAGPWAWPLSPPKPPSAVGVLGARAPPPSSSVRRSQLGVWRR